MRQYLPVGGEQIGHAAIGHFMHRWGNLEKWLTIHVRHVGGEPYERARDKVREWAKTVKERYGPDADHEMAVDRVSDEILDLLTFRNKLCHSAIPAISNSGQVILEYTSRSGKHEQMRATADDIHRFAFTAMWLSNAAGVLTHGDVPPSLEFFLQEH